MPPLILGRGNHQSRKKNYKKFSSWWLKLYILNSKKRYILLNQLLPLWWGDGKLFPTQLCSLPLEDSTIWDPDIGSFSMAIKAKAFRANYPWEVKLDIVFEVISGSWFVWEDETRSYQDYKEEQKGGRKKRLHGRKQIKNLLLRGLWKHACSTY